MDNSQYLYNDKIFLLICSAVFIIIYLIYLIPILLYIKNFLKKKICVYWIDYSFLITYGIIFIFTFFVKLIKETLEGNKQDIKYEHLSKNVYYILIKTSLNLMCLTIMSSLFFDSIIACKLSYKMNKIKKIEDTDYIPLSEKLKNINIVNILTFKFRFNYYVFSFSFNIICIVLVILCYIEVLSNDIQSFIKEALRIGHLFILLLLIFSIIIMNINKKVLLRKNYYSRNRIAQKIYNVYFNQIIYFTDIISFKLVSDLIMNIPVLLFLSHFKFNCISLVISEFSIFLYIFLGGCEYLTIDKNSEASKINKILEYLFLMKYLDFHFGEKDHSLVIDQFKFNYTKEEQKIISNLNLTIINNIENNITDFDERDNIDKIDEKLNLEVSTDNIFVQKEINLEFKTIQEFYLVQKLMMHYFNENKKVYELNTDNNNNDDSYINVSFSLKRKKKNKIMNAQDKNNYLSNIAELSRKSVLDGNKIKSYLKMANYNMFYSIKEKELYEELKSIFNFKNEKHEFIIENIFATKLFELFPFYQMNINLIINSLEPSKNIKIFNKFANRNKKRKIKEPKNRFSVQSTYGRNSNIKNEENEDDDESLIEEHLYYTNDLFLMYEIYDEDEYNWETLNNIITEYNKYLLSVVKNLNYTFLPLILGIFQIEIFHCKKIVILYRNPLYFTNYINLNRWINFFLTEESEKIKLSTIFNDIIDMNEDEIKNNLQIGEVDYDEIVQILENDFRIIKKIKNIYPMIHIFLGEESNINDNSKKKIKNKNQYIENSLVVDSLSSSQNILDIIDKDISYSNDNIVTNEESLFEKEYYYMNGTNIKTIKLYFTNLFRNNCKLNHIKIKSNYCKFMQDKIFNYLSKNSLFTEEKNEKSKDDKDKELD